MFPSWLQFALLSAFFAGITAVFGKLGVEHINSNLATFIRTIVILSIIGLLLTARREWHSLSNVSWHSWLFLIISGIATGLSWLCYYRALQLGQVSKVAPIDKLSVVFAITMGIIFLGEKLTWQTALGGGLILCGSLVIAIF